MNLPYDEKVKYEVAEELGLLEKIVKNGWKGLSSEEAGRIGGIVKQRRKEDNMPKKD